MENLESIKEFIKDKQIALLYLTTKSCNVCKVLKPKIQDICKSFPLVQEKYIELDYLPELKGEFSVFTVPTILLFVEGKETLRLSRNIDLYDFELKIKRYSELLEGE